MDDPDRWDKYGKRGSGKIVFTPVKKPSDHPQHTGFAYPPATEKHLRSTDAALGFPLPPLLRALYAQVANGGFGPFYGLIGVRGGHQVQEEQRLRATTLTVQSPAVSFPFPNVPLMFKQVPRQSTRIWLYVMMRGLSACL